MRFPFPPPTRRTRRFALLAVLALLLAACAPWDTPGGGSPGGGGMHGDMPMGDMHGTARSAGEEQAPAPVEGASEIHVQATEMAFTPAELDLAAGEIVNVTVSNDGQLFHDFVLDEAGVHLNLDPGEQATAALTFAEPGTYEAICTVTGHAEAGMVLTVDVH
jgi:plastocyanin